MTAPDQVARTEFYPFAGGGHPHMALANRTARIVWAVMKRGDGYKAKEIVGQAA